jgi:NADH dehydrogenase [ubiquinone] 1 alpha subcomplex assembly factor 5
MHTNTPPEIFDRNRRRAFRCRADGKDGFLWPLIAEEMAERLIFVSRQFDRILFIGPIAAWAREIMGERTCTFETAHLSGDHAIDEDRLPYALHSYDLIITACTLDSVNDLPGALIQMRKILRPDGLLLATLFGAGSLQMLKRAMMKADGDKARAHIHPQIDLRSAADLLSRTGFALPVADQDDRDVRYADWRTLVTDLRDMGAGNAMVGTRRYLGRNYPARLDAAWAKLYDEDGRVTERFSLLHLSGWSPSPYQPKPAKRGSGTMSLAQALKPKE